MLDNRKKNMDTRTKEQIQTETINSTLELQDVIGILFPWKTSYNDNEIILNNDTIQLIIKKLKQYERGFSG